ncbi:MAG: branched-chain amino acid ABC transporter permease [Ancylobacter novellus]|uniref:Branched-chain amino acid ABC transporter permease n=1 Tax=Ancylobacter novellus TaxID=921 RepID=A0A2W5LUA0_ANCNO|nr:MAG: branched-chain amino acid ABC transporter permease [Ancylobacter novellus]
MPAPSPVAHDTTSRPVLRGLRDSLPVVAAMLPFGALFGALAVSNGLTPLEAVLMSATVLGGASQMVGIELFGQKAHPALIVLAIFAVNFRHVLYSAAIGRHIAHWPRLRQAAAFFLLTDPVFAEGERQAQAGLPIEPGWYFGMGLSLWACWTAQTALGAAFGGFIKDPHALGLDFLLPIYFLGLVMGFRTRSLWAPVVLVSAAASMLAYRYVGSPWHVSIGGLAGVALAALLPPRKEPPR